MNHRSVFFRKLTFGTSVQAIKLRQVLQPVSQGQKTLLSRFCPSTLKLSQLSLSPKRLVPLILGAIFITELGVMLMLTLLPPLSEPLRAIFDASCLLLVLSPIFYFSLYRPILHQQQERKEVIDTLCASENEIRTLSHKLINTSEEEKKHLAQDLHDEFGQVLTAFKLEVEMLRNKQHRGKDEYLFHCDRLLKLISRLDLDLRTVCDQLRPVMLDDVGLVETLRWHIHEFMQLDKSIEVDFQINGQQALSRDLQIVLYRICQEALNNVAKHAGPCHVDIELDLNPEHVSLTIQDNGRGIDDALLRNLNHSSWGLGVLGMRERAAAVGGLLTVSSRKRQGVVIHAELPVCHTEYLSHAD